MTHEQIEELLERLARAGERLDNDLPHSAVDDVIAVMTAVLEDMAETVPRFDSERYYCPDCERPNVTWDARSRAFLCGSLPRCGYSTKTTPARHIG